MTSEIQQGPDSNGHLDETRARIRLIEEKMRKEKLTALSRLAGGIAHDLNNMLTPIMAYGSMVLEELPPDSPLREYMQEVVKAGERMLATAKTLQGLRIKTSGLIPLEVNETVQSQLDRMRSELTASLNLDVRLGDDAGRAMGENGAIERIVEELVRNSIQAMPAGGMVSVSTRREIEAGLPLVVMTVKDQGSGMTPEVLEHIGEPYFTTKPKGQAKGLGLAVVYSSTTRAGGFVRYTTAPGEGTEFNIYLQPAAPMDG